MQLLLRTEILFRHIFILFKFQKQSPLTFAPFICFQGSLRDQDVGCHAHGNAGSRRRPAARHTAGAGGSGCSNLSLPSGKRGHKRSVSLENNAPLALRSTPSMGQSSLGSPLLQFGQAAPGQGHSQGFHTGTLKSRQEQRRLSQKFGSHSNLDDEGVGIGVGMGMGMGLQMRSKFQNIRQMFELSRSCVGGGGGDGRGARPRRRQCNLCQQHCRSNISSSSSRGAPRPLPAEVATSNSNKWARRNR